MINNYRHILLPQPLPRTFDTTQLLQRHLSHKANTTSYVLPFITSSHTDKAHDTKSHQCSNDYGHDNHIVHML